MRCSMSLALTPGSLVRFTFRKSAPGRIRTDTAPGLSRMPLLVGLRDRDSNWSRRQDLHPHCSASETDASSLGYAGEKLNRTEADSKAPALALESTSPRMARKTIRLSSRINSFPSILVSHSRQLLPSRLAI